MKKEMENEVKKRKRYTVVQSSLMLGHLINYFPMSLGVSESASKLMNERSRARVEQANK